MYTPRPPPLNILLIEDRATEAALIERELRRADLAFVVKCVDNRQAFVEALEVFKPDVVVADCLRSGFSCRDALEHVRVTHPEVPVVIVDGALGEESAIELLKAGAKDYVLKNNLLRLPSAVERAISVEAGIRARKAAERAMRASEEKFRTLVENANDVIWQMDNCGTFTYLSQRVKEVHGYEPAELIGKPVLDLITDAERPKIASFLRGIISEPKAFALIRTRCRHRDGRDIVVEVNGTPIFEEAGSLAGFHGVTRDITERAHAEERLEASEARFRLLVEEAPDAILLYDVDQDRFVSANKAAERLIGRVRQEIVQYGARHFYSAGQPDGHPIAETFAEHVARAVAGEKVTFERRISNAAGEERLCEVTLVPLPSETSRLLRASYVDITEQRRAERELASRAAILATEHELSPDGILVVDQAAKIVSVNDRFSEIFRVPPEMIVAADDKPVLSWATGQMVDRKAFLSRVRYLYDHPEERSRDEIGLVDGRVIERHSASMQAPGGGHLGRVWFFRDVTDRIEASRVLVRLNRTLRTLSRGNEVVVRAADERELVHEMCRTIVETGGYRMAWIGMVEHDAAKSVTPVAWAGNVQDYLEKVQITWSKQPRGRGPGGRAIRSGQPQVTQDFGIDPSMVLWREEARQCGFASSAVLPLKDGSGVFAALMIYAAEPNAFDADALRLLQELADDLSHGIRALRDRQKSEAAEQRWRSSLEATIGAIASTVETRDPYTAGHQERVAALAVAIAGELRLSADQIHGLRLASVIHDVGKINIPAEILSHPGRLSPAQHQLIREHAEAGYAIVKGVDFPWPIADIVRQHHERLDGSGYPQGLKGKAILQEARILAVADVVEAMMSHRPYRPGRGIEAALAEVEAGKGRHYDTAAVEACTALFRQNRFSFD